MGNLNHLEVFESWGTGGRLNDYDRKDLIGKKIKFPNGKLKFMYEQWRGDYKSVAGSEMSVDPNQEFTVKKEEKIYWGSRGEKTTAPMLLIADHKGSQYYIGSQMGYEPIEIIG